MTVSKIFDASKFQKSIVKTVKNISIGFNDPEYWISTGNYCLNKRLSGDFTKGIPLGKQAVIAGESGSGKSLLMASIIKNAQANDVFPIVIDTENALDGSWLEKLGVDISEGKILKISSSMINNTVGVLNDFFEDYKSSYGHLSRNERPKVLLVIDSLSMLLSETEVNQFQDAELKGDKGIKAKQLKALLINCINTIGDNNIGMVCTSHTYKSQNMYDPTDIISGGTSFQFAPSIICILNKFKLKEDEGGAKTSDVQGIRSQVNVVKTRYAQPFVKVELKIPYLTGLDPYSGLLEYFENLGVVEKIGNKLYYKAKDGREFKEWRKDFGPEILDIIMNDWDDARDKLEVSTPE